MCGRINIFTGIERKRTLLMSKEKSRLKKEAEKEFRKLPKKEQERINRLKRIPVPAPGTVFDKKKDAPRQKKWDETME